MSVSTYLSIANFYAGRSVFITGGAGFLGKVLLEKLLYSCPKVDKVFLLLRDKNNYTTEQRFQDIINLPVFNRLKKERPQALNKVVLMKGDISDHNLNLQSKDLETLKQQVSVVFHSAASVKFNEPLEVALKTNVEGTRNVLNLCHQIPDLQAFVHISTAYCHSNNAVIEERLYPPPASIEEAYDFLKQKDCKHKTASELFNGRPNTYTFTKALAENLVSETHGDIPTVIIRPSIVTPSNKEPVRGWVDNRFVATNFFMSVGKGYCRAIYSYKNHIADMIPVDYVSNLTLVAAARAKRDSELTIYNSCSGSSNPIKMEQAFDLFSRECVKNNINNLPYPGLLLTDQQWLLGGMTAFTYLIAVMADLVQAVKRIKPKYTKRVYLTTKMRDESVFFTSNSWLMKTDRAEALFKTLSPEDAQEFPFLAKDIEWNQYMTQYLQGVKKYLMK